MRPHLLDLFCGAGGCTKGYQRAGFFVVGVDINPQPNYCGDRFIQADALQFLRDPGRFVWPPGGTFAAIHASPPCQVYTLAFKLAGGAHPDLIGPVRELLLETGRPYVIENVRYSPLHDDAQMLEGQMFDLNTHRPRLFETNWGYEAPLLRPPPPRQAKMGRKPKAGEAIQVVGHFTDMEAARRAMGIDWMNRRELANAIPPAYTEHIGKALMAHLTQEAVAA